jgi:hypothetical protein
VRANLAMKPRDGHVPPEGLFFQPTPPGPALARRDPTARLAGRVLLAYGLVGMIATLALCAVFFAGAKFEQHRHSALGYAVISDR